MNLQQNAYAPIDGTSLQGFIPATAAQLERVFGEPEVCHPEDKMPLRWTLVDADMGKDCLVATIYLWRKPVPNSDQMMTWNIGGHSPAAAARVLKAFNEAMGQLDKAA